MKKFASFVVDKRYWIFSVFVILVVLSVVAIFFVNVNSDIMSYLPEKAEMTQGLHFMQGTFNMQGDAEVGVDGVNFAQMNEVMKKVEALVAEESSEGVAKGRAIWIGTILSMKDMDPSMKAMAKSIAGIDIDAMADDMKTNQSLLNIFYPNPQEDGTIVFDENAQAKYLFMLQLNVPASSDEAMNLLGDLDKILKDSGYRYSIGGSTQMVKDIFDSTINEMYKYILVAVLVMFIVLFLTTTSFIEPVIFMLTIGISIIVNMGSNILFGEVSIVTFACSAVLQLGLSMDYSIFLMHAFAEEKKKNPFDEKLAMKNAIPKTFATVTASALTTVGGFLALFVMQFEIGADLGKVLAKGVFLSLVTVILLQPCLMLMMSKWTEKAEHRILLPKFKGAGKFAITHRYIIVIIAIIILVPSIVLQTLQGNNLSYLKFVETPEREPGSIEETVDTLSNSVIVMVPVYDRTKGATKKDYSEENFGFCDDLKKLSEETGNVTAYMSMYTMLGDKAPEMIEKLTTKAIQDMLVKYPEAGMITGFINKDENGKYYTLYEIMINCPAESDDAAYIVNKVNESLANRFGPNEETHIHYTTGMSQAVLDLKDITPRDNQLVSIISILVILVILIITQKSIKLPIILIGLIEFGIFINLSLCYIFGEDINFMCYIILSSIQLGSTVDYAILYTDKYQKNLEFMSANEAAYKALRDSAFSILTSVAIMAGCTLSVTIVASNTIVKQITWLIARGSIISGFLTIVVLPALLVVFTGNKKLKKRGRQEARLLKLVEKTKKKQEAAK